jgi:hypothetical protein
VDQFRKDLTKYKPYIRSAKDTKENLDKINKKTANDPELDLVSSQIAFSRSGLGKLGIVDKLQDATFDAGSMQKVQYALGDRSKWDLVFEKANLDGVILITTKCQSHRFEKNPSLTVIQLTLHVIL